MTHEIWFESETSEVYELFAQGGSSAAAHVSSKLEADKAVFVDRKLIRAHPIAAYILYDYFRNLQ